MSGEVWTLRRVAAETESAGRRDVDAVCIHDTERLKLWLRRDEGAQDRIEFIPVAGRDPIMGGKPGGDGIQHPRVFAKAACGVACEQPRDVPRAQFGVGDHLHPIGQKPPDAQCRNGDGDNANQRREGNGRHPALLVGIRGVHVRPVESGGIMRDSCRCRNASRIPLGQLLTVPGDAAPQSITRINR